MAKKYKKQYIYVKEICDLIESNRVNFMFAALKDAHGFYVTIEGDTNFHLIILDPRKEFIATLVHECVHFIYPELAETDILNIEEIVMSSPPKTIIKILNIFSTKARFCKLSPEEIL